MSAENEQLIDLITSMRTEMHNEFNYLKNELNEVNKKVKKVETRLTSIDDKIGNIENRLNELEGFVPVGNEDMIAKLPHAVRKIARASATA